MFFITVQIYGNEYLEYIGYNDELHTNSVNSILKKHFQEAKGRPADKMIQEVLEKIAEKAGGMFAKKEYGFDECPEPDARLVIFKKGNKVSNMTYMKGKKGWSYQI